MSILGTIMSKVFSHAPANASTPNAPAPDNPAATPASPAAAAAPATPSAPTPISQAEVETILSNIAATYNHPVNWRESIVDLLAMLQMDNSLAQRKALAHELGYTGDTNDTATMNVWLHKEVMKKLAENGGFVPSDLRY